MFADDAWLLKDLNGPDVERERRTVGFEPTVVASFRGLVIDRIDKIVAPSRRPRPARPRRIRGCARPSSAASANVERSQAYYIDISHPLANKGDGR